ncbi:MAG: type II secretion system F family protein [Candidatus Kappaea frigidicola]|nr:type II secretion system F family protein [Candidatus Kappaea frigidicola]
MIVIFYLALAAGFILFFLGLLPKAKETISVFGDKLKRKQKGSFSAPFLSIFVPINKTFLQFFKLEKILGTKLSIVKWKISPSEFLSVKELAAIFLPLILYFIFDVESKVWLSVACLGGFLLPTLILKNKIKATKYSIERVLPETVDLLSLCVGAGLDFMSSVRWIVNKVKVNPLIEELVIVLKEINVGKPRLEALRDMSKRLNIPDVTSFVRTLIQADRMGTPVEETFKILSEDSRMRRFHRGERTAMKAPIKMLVPLIFCILPVIMIIVAGPILVNFMTKGLFDVG